MSVSLPQDKLQGEIPPCWVVSKVVVLHDFMALQPWIPAFDALNAACRRPSPFQAPRYLATYESHNECVSNGSHLMLMLAFAGDELMGYLPLRRCVDARWLGLGIRIDFMTARDCDRPFVVSRPPHETICALAFMQHLACQKPSWSLLQLAEQDADSALLSAARTVFSSITYKVRTYPNNPNGSVILGDGGFAG